MIKFFLAFLFCWSQCHTAAFGLDIAKLNGMTAADRLVWVNHFVEEELGKKDSAVAFRETNVLLRLAKKWDAADIAAKVYTGQGDYLLQVLRNFEEARNKYAQGIDFANLHDLKGPVAGMLIQIGRSYCQENQSILAYGYFCRAHEMLVQTGLEGVDHIGQYEYDIGRFFYDIADYETTMSHLAIAERCPHNKPQLRYDVLMIMEKCCVQLGWQEKAFGWLQKRAQVANQEGNTAWIGECAVDIGEYHLRDGCYPEARIYLSTGYKLLLQAGQFQSVARALILLSTVNIQEHNLYAAAEKLTEAERYLQQTGAGNCFPDLYRNRMLIYEQADNFREAYRYQQLYEHTYDSIRRANELLTYTNIQVRLEGRRHMVQMIQQQQADRTDRLLVLLAVAVLTVSGLGIYFGWKHQQRQQKALIAARQQAEQAEQALRQVNEQRQVEEVELMSELGMLSGDDTSSPPLPAADPKADQTAKEAVEQILQMTLLTEDDSRHFRLLFERIHPGFFTQLRTNFPDLTQSETRLLALTKLSLKTREMSEILKVEPNSIRRSRNRIRQKYNLPAGDNFDNLLTKY